MVGYSIALFGLYLFREYKSDASALRNKLLHSRAVLCEYVCIIFTIAPSGKNDEDDDGVDGDVEMSGEQRGSDLEIRETAPLLERK